jgi:hypothetical protein
MNSMKRTKGEDFVRSIGEDSDEDNEDDSR